MGILAGRENEAGAARLFLRPYAGLVRHFSLNYQIAQPAIKLFGAVRNPSEYCAESNACFATNHINGSHFRFHPSWHIAGFFFSVAV